MAKEGITNIKNHYLDQVKTLLDQNNTTDAESMANTALRFFPGDTDLAEIKQLVQTASIKLKSNKIGHLISKAQQEISNGQLASPTATNAAATLQQALELEPNNQNIQVEVDRLLSKIVENSAQLIQNNELGAAEQLLQGGRKVSPQNQKISALLNLISETRGENQAKLQAESKAKEDISNKVDSLIEQANSLLAQEKLVSPEKNNALYFYSEALRLMPDSQEAQDGVNVIRGYYLTQISGHITNQEIESAEKALNQALLFFPDDTSLLEKKDVLFNLQGQLQEDNIANLVDKANKAFSQGKLMAPASDNAVEYSRQILQMDPTNIDAQNVLINVGNSFYEKAIDFNLNGEWDKSLAAINKALQIWPENTTYSDLRDQIYQETARQNDLQQKFVQTRRILSTTFLALPEATQAHTLLLSILESDPDNAEAQASMQELQIKLLDSANKKLAAKQTAESLAYTQSALTIFPNNKRLKKLVSVIQKTESDNKIAIQRREIIESHLSKARQLMTAGTYYSPRESNAGLYFSKALELDPDNPVSIDGLEEILTNLKTKIESLKSQGSNQQALQELDLGRQLFPGNIELSNLRETLLSLKQKSEEKSKTDNEIKALLSEASKHFKAKRWSSPANRNALNTYKEILAIDPDNKAALVGIDKIHNKYVTQANKHIKAKNWRSAESTINRGRTVFPNSNKDLMH